MGAAGEVRTRTDLIQLLNEAAALEHSLCAQYLFAAFSMKADVSEGLTHEEMNRVTQWERLLLMVARQEMEHLGLVSNLLTSIGGAPTFDHPSFPYPTSLYRRRMTLERFSEATIERFVCFERPQKISPEDAFCGTEQLSSQLAPGPYGYKTVGELYLLIRKTIVDLSARGVDLFVGQAENEVTGGELGLDFPRFRAKGGVYDVFLFAIADEASALKAIDLILEQGEGTPHDGDASHYRTFLSILTDYKALKAKNPAFEAARNVVDNPVLFPGRPFTTPITNEATRAVMALFGDSYALMLFMLLRLFTHTDETVAELEELKSAAFFPFMTMLIRPLAEVLTSMPVKAVDDGTRAGPCFDVPPNLAFLPHKKSAFVVIGEQLDRLCADAKAIANLPGIPARIGYVAETLRLIAMRYHDAVDPKVR